MRVVIVTGRGFTDAKLLDRKLARLTGGLRELVVSTRRGCPLVQDWAYTRKRPYLVWQRDETDDDMLAEAGAVVLFLTGSDPATNGLILKAQKKGLKVRIIQTEDDDEG